MHTVKVVVSFLNLQTDLNDLFLADVPLTYAAPFFV